MNLSKAWGGAGVGWGGRGGRGVTAERQRRVWGVTAERRVAGGLVVEGWGGGQGNDCAL